MFLIRLIHLKNIKKISSNVIEKEVLEKDDIKLESALQIKENEDLFGIKDKLETIGQIKNIVQEKDIKVKENQEIETKTNVINSFNDLLEICSFKKEIKLKYELEKNVNLVSFEKQRIEISFNESLDKDFIKDLSSKLYEWTDSRWIITLSKTRGQPSKKEEEVNLKKNLIKNAKSSSVYNEILKKFPDAELVDVKEILKDKKK
jgi:DNA polymerase-3 subunit gamma/tau